MRITEENIYTVDDIMELPENAHVELIDGKLYYMDIPPTSHQAIAGKLLYDIYMYLKEKNLKQQISVARYGVFLEPYNKTFVIPDISVICDSTKFNEYGCVGAPDWIIEIVTENSRSINYSTKLFKYYDSGVREYWIVDYLKNRIWVYDFEKENFGDYTFSDTVKVGIFDDLEINFSELDI